MNDNRYMAGRRQIMARFTPAADDSRDFDVEFWQAQGTSAIFTAARDLVRTAAKMKGLDERRLELQRSVARFRPAPRAVPDRRRLRRDGVH